ncbi:MAG: sporulation protein YqfC, partial [Firmicutes bacterium]|nr:sporulation protein YqfC [Bacillota bacterium]
MRPRETGRQSGRSGIRRRVAELLELPGDVVLNVPRLTIVGNLHLVVENHRGLLEYSPSLIRVGTPIGQLTIVGEDLTVGSVFAEDLTVMGRFRRLIFEDATLPPEEAGDGRGDRAAGESGGPER